MAITGPAPKENRRRTNKDIYADIQARLEEDGELRGPELPDDMQWLPQVLRWYETWRRSPQAATFTNTDWQRLHMIAPIVQGYYIRPHHLVMAEIRQSETLLGATYTDRLRARMKVEKPGSGEPAKKADLKVIDSYRKRLAG